MRKRISGCGVGDGEYCEGPLLFQVSASLFPVPNEFLKKLG